MKIITYHEKFPVKGVKCYILRKLEEYVVLEKCSRWSMTSLANLNIIRSLDVEKSLWLQVPLIFTFTILEDDLQNYFSLSSYMRVLLFLNHEQRYEIACRWLRTSLLPKNKSFCSVRNPFGKWKLWQLYIERDIMQTYLQISFLNPIRFDPFGTICHINGLMQKSHWYFAPFVEAWKGSNK